MSKIVRVYKMTIVLHLKWNSASLSSREINCLTWWMIVFSACGINGLTNRYSSLYPAL